MKLHFIGICGTGMGSLAGLCKARGHEVRGSDCDVYPPMSTQLAGWGIPVMNGFSAEHLDWQPDQVVVGNVCRRDHPEVLAAQARGIPLISFPALLGEQFLAARHSIVVAGTHGKTTTSSLVAWLLTSAGRQPGFLIGGVPANFGAGFAAGSGAEFVVEGDEYDTAYFDKGPKFLHYRPRTVLLTSVEYDHADIYPSLDAVAEGFRKLLRLVPGREQGGRVVVCASEGLAARLASERTVEGATAPLVERYGVEGDGVEPAQCEWLAAAVAPRSGVGTAGLTFELRGPAGRSYGRFATPLFGRHNLRNATGALAVALGLGADPEAVRRGLAEFQGVRRRQEVRARPQGIAVIDDFAHHPTAVRETLAAVRAAHLRGPGQLWAVYEPRTATSRRNVFQAEYPAAFDLADRVIIARPHAPEKVPEAERFDAQALVRDLAARRPERPASYGAQVHGGGGIVAHIAAEARPGDVVLVMSTGGFEGLIDALIESLGGATRPEDR